MKCMETMVHNHADKVVPQHLRDEVLDAIRETHGSTLKEVHKPLQAALKARGWQTNVAVAPGLKFTFDALKDGIAVEIESWTKEDAFKEWGKFQKAFSGGTVTAGVHIVRGKAPDAADCSSKWVHSTLGSFSDVFSVPVLVIGVDL